MNQGSALSVRKERYQILGTELGIGRSVHVISVRLQAKHSKRQTTKSGYMIKQRLAIIGMDVTVSITLSPYFCLLTSRTALTFRLRTTFILPERLNGLLALLLRL